jgi:hypothetical protein
VPESGKSGQWEERLKIDQKYELGKMAKLKEIRTAWKMSLL